MPLSAALAAYECRFACVIPGCRTRHSDCGWLSAHLWIACSSLQPPQLILERIQRVQPMFDSESLRQAGLQQEKYVMQMSDFATGRRGDPTRFHPIKPARPQSALPNPGGSTATERGSTGPRRPGSAMPRAEGSGYMSYGGSPRSARMRPTSAPVYQSNYAVGLDMSSRGTAGQQQQYGQSPGNAAVGNASGAPMDGNASVSMVRSYIASQLPGANSSMATASGMMPHQYGMVPGMPGHHSQQQHLSGNSLYGGLSQGSLGGGGVNLLSASGNGVVPPLGSVPGMPVPSMGGGLFVPSLSQLAAAQAAAITNLTARSLQQSNAPSLSSQPSMQSIHSSMSKPLAGNDGASRGLTSNRSFTNGSGSQLNGPPSILTTRSTEGAGSGSGEALPGNTSTPGAPPSTRSPAQAGAEAGSAQDARPLRSTASLQSVRSLTSNGGDGVDTARSGRASDSKGGEPPAASLASMVYEDDYADDDFRDGQAGEPVSSASKALQQQVPAVSEAVVESLVRQAIEGAQAPSAESSPTAADDATNTSPTGSSLPMPRSVGGQAASSSAQPGSRPTSARMMRPESAKGRRPGSAPRRDSASRSAMQLVSSGSSSAIGSTVAAATIPESGEEGITVKAPSPAEDSSSSPSAAVSATSTSSSSARPGSAGGNRPMRPESARPGSARNGSSAAAASGSAASAAPVGDANDASMSAALSGAGVLSRPWSSSRRVYFRDYEDSTAGGPQGGAAAATLDAPMESPVVASSAAAPDGSVSAADEETLGDFLLQPAVEASADSKDAGTAPSSSAAAAAMDEADLADDSFIKEDPAGDDADSIGPDHHEPWVNSRGTQENAAGGVDASGDDEY